jgi:hypothetical protein
VIAAARKLAVIYYTNLCKDNGFIWIMNYKRWPVNCNR